MTDFVALKSLRETYDGPVTAPNNVTYADTAVWRGAMS